jgi:hypothetical protein
MMHFELDAETALALSHLAQQQETSVSQLLRDFIALSQDAKKAQLKQALHESKTSMKSLGVLFLILSRRKHTKKLRIGRSKCWKVKLSPFMSVYLSVRMAHGSTAK